MLTIKGFAQLCRCSAQTLRYYDKVGLLKPVRVDKWSGYRYYEEKQAVDFVKIKNLQAADFTIGEITELLSQPDEAVYEAFGQKIAAQREKLERILQIQQTYLHEKSSMEKIYQRMASFLLEQCRKAEILQEFGLQPQDYDRIMTTLRDWMEQKFAESYTDTENIRLQINDEVTEGTEQIAGRIATLTRDNLSDTILLTDTMKVTQEQYDAENFEPVWEKHGWAHVRDFIDDIPPLTGPQDYLLDFRLCDPTLLEDLSFAMFSVGIMLIRHGDSLCLEGCCAEKSDDGLNHFTLMRRK